MNYLLHNMGYDEPIDFRWIVLYTYKSRCMWLRDTPIDHLGLHDYTKWLPDIKYEQSNLERAKKSYKETKLKLANLTKETLQTRYTEELRKYEVLNNCKNSYHADQAATIKRCADEYRTHLDKWLALHDTANWLTGELIEIYDTAIADMKEHEDENVKDVQKMHNQTPPTFEEFVENEFKHLESNISFYAERIKSTKRAIKIIEGQCEEVKRIFAWLDQIEQEENKNESCN